MGAIPSPEVSDTRMYEIMNYVFWTLLYTKARGFRKITVT